MCVNVVNEEAEAHSGQPCTLAAVGLLKKLLQLHVIKDVNENVPRILFSQFRL